MPELRTFKLRVGESGEWCQEGTLVKVEAADLEQLCATVGERLGLVGVQVEIFDSDFDEWVGPFALDDVPAVASVRVRAQGKQRPPSPVADTADVAAAPAAAASGDEQARMATKLRSLEQAYQIGALSEQKYLSALARVKGAQDESPAATPAAAPPLQPGPQAQPEPQALFDPQSILPDVERQDRGGALAATAEEAAPPAATLRNVHQQARAVQSSPAQPTLESSIAHGKDQSPEPQRDLELDPADEADLTPEEIAELASLYPRLIGEDGSPRAQSSDESLGEFDEMAAHFVDSAVTTSQTQADDTAAKDAALAQATRPKPNLGAEIAMRERVVRESFDTAKRRAHDDAERRAVAADWRGLGQWTKGQTEAVVERRVLAEATVEAAVKEMWTAIEAQEDASAAIGDARHRAQRKGLVQRRAGTVSGRGAKKFTPMWVEVKAGSLTWLDPADAAAAEAAGLALSVASQEPPVVLTQCSVRYLSSAEAAKAQLPTPHVFRLELAATGVEDSKSRPSWLLALDTADEMNGWIETMKCNSGLAQCIHELQEHKEQAATSANEYQTNLLPAAVEELALAFLMEKRDVRLSGFNASIENHRPSVSESAPGPQRSTSPTPFGSSPGRRGSMLVVQPSTRFAVGHADDIGKRPTMEDCSTVHGCFRGFATEDYFAVFDGHGGIEVAEYAAQYMHQHLEAALAPLGPRTPSEKQMDSAFTTAFAATNEFESLVPNSSVARSCGCTAVVAMVINSMLHVANAGDARAVLCRAVPDDGIAPAKGIRLSVDHKPGLVEERRRIEAGGGQVLRRRGVDRVEGFLAVSRALGDLGLAPHVTCAPFTSSTKLGPLDEYLILACDGVWDVLSDDEAAAIVSTRARLSPEKGGGVDGAAQALVDISLRKGSTDNITVQVIALRKSPSEKQQQEKAEAPIVVGSVADAMAMVESMPAAASAPPAAVVKKRKGRRIGASTEIPVEELTAHHEQSQGADEKRGGMDDSPELSEVISGGGCTAPQSDEQLDVSDHEPELRLEPELDPSQTHPVRQKESIIDPSLLALVTASVPAAEDRGAAVSPRSKEARRQAFTASVQTGDELLSAADPAGAVHAYMEALELGTAGERLQAGRSLSNAQLLLAQSLAREAVRAQNSAGLSQLITAVGARAPELVSAFFDESQGVTLVYFAAQENDHETLKLLLAPVAPSTGDAGIAPHRGGRRGSLPNALVFGGQHRLADRPANNGGTPLFVAAKLGNSLAVRALISGACEVDAVVSSPGQPIDGLSALLIGTRQGHCDVVQQLLGARADPNQRMADGTGPVHLATAHGHALVIRLLSNAGADMNARKDSKKQVTPLLSAAQILNADVVEALIDGGADLSRQVYTPSGEVQTTLRYAFGVAMKASRSRSSSSVSGTAATAAQVDRGRASGLGSAEQTAAKRVMEMLQRASRRPVLAAHQRLSLAKLLPPASTNVRHHLALSRVFTRIVTRMPLPTCQLTVLWSREMAAERQTVASSSWPAQKPTTRLSLGSAAVGIHQSANHLPSSPSALSPHTSYGSPRHETRRWEDVAPQEWSTDLVRQWSTAVLHTNSTAPITASEALESNSTSAQSSRLVSAGLAASMVDGEALLGIPSFKVLHSVIGSDIPAGPVLKFWGALQQLQTSTGLPSCEDSAIQLAAEKQWEELEQGIERLEARRTALKSAVSQASMELHTDRTLREGIEAELSQMRSQVEWVRAHSSHFATPTRPRGSKSR